MVSQVLDKLNREHLKDAAEVAFKIGDLVKVHTRIHEGEKERIQIFPGTIIGRDGGGARETFTVRRVSHGVGVERVFPVHSPFIAKIEVQSSSCVRRAKLYYLRSRAGKKARLKEKANG